MPRQDTMAAVIGVAPAQEIRGGLRELTGFRERVLRLFGRAAGRPVRGGGRRCAARWWWSRRRTVAGRAAPAAARRACTVRLARGRIDAGRLREELVPGPRLAAGVRDGLLHLAPKRRRVLRRTRLLLPPSQHSNGQPIAAGWSYRWIAQLHWAAGSWTRPRGAGRQGSPRRHGAKFRRQDQATRPEPDQVRPPATCSTAPSPWWPGTACTHGSAPTARPAGRCRSRPAARPGHHNPAAAHPDAPETIAPPPHPAGPPSKKRHSRGVAQIGTPDTPAGPPITNRWPHPRRPDSKKRSSEGVLRVFDGSRGA